MKRRNKQTIEYYGKRMSKMFERYPETKLVENRYIALRVLLQEKYGFIWEGRSKQFIEDFLKDVVTEDRELRRATEDLQKEQKKILAQEFVVEHYNLSPSQKYHTGEVEVIR